jgi:hypothetical protein
VIVSQLSVKLFAREAPPSLEPLIPIFHRWIRDGGQRLAGQLLIDVADYRHVVDGPGVVLIGYGAHWGVGGVGGGGLGLVYARKRDPAGELGGKLAEALHDALRAASMLEAEAGLGLAFDASRIRVRVLDRLHARNDADGFAAARPELGATAARLWGEASLVHVADDPRAPLSIDVVGRPATVAELLARLA